MPAHPAAAEIFQYRLRITIDRIAESAASGNIVDEQASFGQWDSFRHAGGQSRFAPSAFAHGSGRGLLAFFDSIEHRQTGFDDHPRRAVSRRVAAGETEAALSNAAVRLVVDAAVFRSVNEINAMTAQTAAVLAEAAAVGIVRAREIEKRILHLDALDIADAGGGNIHVAAGVDAVAVRRRAHARAMNIVKPLGDGDALARMAAVKVTGPADEFQIARRRRIDVVVASGSVDHLRHGFTDCGNEHVADARTGAAGRGILAVQNRPFGHVHFHGAHLAVAPRHVPEERVGQRQREMSDGARQGGVMIGIGLRAGVGEIEVKLVALFRHRAVELLRYGFSAFFDPSVVTYWRVTQVPSGMERSLARDLASESSIIFSPAS